MTDQEKRDLPNGMEWADRAAAYRIAGRLYVSGQDRCEPNTVAHLYRGTMRRVGSPMCRRGWNRLDGHGYSIFRNLLGAGVCKVCLRRAVQKREPVREADRKTKWL